MAIIDDAVMVIGAGNFFVAPVGTALPEDLMSPASPWENVGHTSLEELFGMTSEGGEATNIGTLQNATLRTRYSPRADVFNLTLQQFDEANLRRYFGANAELLPNGLLAIPTQPSPSRNAFLAVFVDGENHFAFYAPQAELFRADDPDFSSTESPAGMPIAVKPIPYANNSYAFAVTPLGGAPVATGATAGTPGVWTPSGAEAPEDLLTLQSRGIIASPSEAWSAGQYVVLGDESEAHWDGDSWVEGKAA